MENKLKQIVLCCENIETLTIPADAVLFCQIDGIKSSIYWAGDFGDYTETSTCEKVYLVIENSINRVLSNNTVFGRLMQYNDIVSVDLYYENGTTNSIYVKYDGEETNALQKTMLTENGNLEIEIG